MSHVDQYISEAITILERVDRRQIEAIIQKLLAIRERRGRLFFIGVGGSAANCTHAVNDFRKLAGMEVYSPVDNVAELTARTNDEGWATVFVEWLRGSRLNSNDGVFVLSVGGGNKEKNVSANIVHALEYAVEQKACILGIVGRDGGFTARVADACVVVPTVNPEGVTPHSEGFQGVFWHLMVSDPRMMRVSNKWESITK
ncbi:MAG: SIS domain-containing protein [Nitrospirae bacterium]|nr:SIS domain-containing protein [Magnetococcales bacterium]HAT50329.1 sugar isomerase [Alphaproteobacteria bacterium]